MKPNLFEVMRWDCPKCGKRNYVVKALHLIHWDWQPSKELWDQIEWDCCDHIDFYNRKETAFRFVSCPPGCVMIWNEVAA